MPDRPPRLALITGASSGIGRALAARFAAAGYDLALTARDPARLAAVAEAAEDAHGISATIHPADLSQADAGHVLFDRLAEDGRTVTALVNNAGFNVWGRFEETDLDRETEMLGLMICTPTVMTKRFLRQRDRAARNLVLNVSSIAAFVPGPKVSVHFASRAHLLSFSLALADEFRRSDVTVTCLCPGPVRSAFFGRAGMDEVRLARGWPMALMTPDEVARIAFQGLLQGRPMVIPGLQNRLVAALARAAPRKAAVAFTRWIMDRAGGRSG